jgi:polyisoprenyl-phosphate glycosyltransferase
MKTIDIVLPVYNEEEGIAAFHEALAAAIEPLGDRYRFHMIYVLDRSRDHSFAVLKKTASLDDRVTVLHLSRRFGHQMSLVAGIDHSRGDAVIMMDSDQQHPPALIPALLEKLEAGFDVVHTIRQYDSGTSFLKRWASNAFYHLQNSMSPVEMRPGAADFRLISRKVAAVFQSSIREQNQFLRGLFQWVGFSATTVSFVSAPRAAGATKYRVGRLLAFAVNGMLSFSKVPLRVASAIGIVISALSLLYGLALVVYFFMANYIPAGYTSLIVVILFMGGLQLTVLGILGEYLGGIFDEVKGRPLYVVDEIVPGGRP